MFRESYPSPDHGQEACPEQKTRWWTSLWGRGTEAFANSDGEEASTLITPGGKLAEYPTRYELPPETGDATITYIKATESSNLFWPEVLEEPPDAGKETGEAYTYFPTTEQPLTDILSEAHNHLRQEPGEETSINRFAVLGENIVARTFPAAHHNEPRDTVSQAEQRIADTQMHHRILACGPDGEDEAAIIIPDTFYETVPDGQGTAHIRVLSAGLEGRPFKHAQSNQIHIIEPDERAAAIRLGNAQARYYDWVLNERPAVVLTDASALAQYRIDAQNRPILPDTDPFTLPLHTPDGRMALLSDILDVEQWVQDAGLQSEIKYDLSALAARAAAYLREIPL